MNAATVPVVPRRLAPYVEGLPRTYWALWAGMLVNRAGSFVMPMLTVYLTRARGLSLTDAGSIVALYGLGSFVGATFGGTLADRLGRRATMLASLLSSAVAMLALGFSSTVPQLVVSTLFLGLTADVFRPALQASVADVVAPEHRMKAFGTLYWAINLGFALAAVIAGFMATRNFTALFIGDALTTVIFAVIVYRAVPETRPAEAAKRAHEGSMLTPFFDARYLPFLVLNLLVATIFFQHLTALPEDMRLKGLAASDFGLAVATNGVLIVLLQPWISKRVGHIARPRLLAVAAALTGVGFGLTALAGSLPAYMLTVAVWTLGEIVFAPVNAAIVADLSPTHLRGRYQGAYNLTWSLSALAAPLLGPRVAAATSMTWLWVGCVGVGLFTAAMHLTLGRRMLAKAPVAKQPAA